MISLDGYMLSDGEKVFDIFYGNYRIVDEVKGSNFRIENDWFSMNGWQQNVKRIFWHDPTTITVPKDLHSFTKAKRILDFIIQEQGK